MPTHPSEIANTLSEKFQLLHEAFTDLTNDATQFHGTLDLRDASSRTLFNSLTRIMAFSDHIHVALNLMGEDVVAISSVDAQGAPRAPADGGRTRRDGRGAARGGGGGAD